jgi:hypothetical protein
VLSERQHLLRDLGIDPSGKKPNTEARAIAVAVAFRMLREAVWDEITWCVRAYLANAFGLLSGLCGLNDACFGA